MNVLNFFFALLIVLSLSGCGNIVPDTEAEFTVVITNLSSGENSTDLSSGVYYTHREGFPLFFTSSIDYGEGLENLAEDGQNGMLMESLLQNESIISIGSFPLFRSGESIEFTFTASYGEFFNFATMFIETNDGFYAYDEEGILLFEPDGTPISGDTTSKIWLWDAGTERNQAPYIGSFQPARQSAPGEGDDTPLEAVRLLRDEFTYPSKFQVINVSVTSTVL